MKLKKLFSQIPVEAIKGSKEIEITGICSHSKWAAPGNLFISKKGLKGDSSFYIAEAIAAGAIAVLTDIYDPFLQNVTQIIHPNVALIEAAVAAYYYQNAHKKLFLIAFTGTNGKTTGTFLTKHLLDGLGLSSGLIGTIEWMVGKHSLSATHTTPDIVTNHKLFFEMVQNGCRAAVMEVSSHALEQERVKGLLFDVAVFTNLTQDHLDYHLTMNSYAAAKSKLFKQHAKAAVINSDSDWSAVMVEENPLPVLTYGIDKEADLRATKISLSSKGIQCTINYKGKTAVLHSNLIGRFNVYNCLAAIGVGLIYGAALEEIVPILSTFKQVPGRLERVPNKAGLPIFVDYAHSENALYNVLSTLKEIKKGRLITLFGCGGDRDRLKRPKMARVAEQFSDLVIVTSDNPRSEDPSSIVQEIMQGFQQPKNVLVELDRADAIHKAVKMIAPNDILLIAGKGHETYQIFAHHTIAFDDRKTAQAAAASLTLNPQMINVSL